MNDIAIQMTGVTKRYRLGQIGHGTLQEDLQSWWARVRGKEDPNRPIQTRQLEGDNFLALQNVDLTVYRGETLGIIGGNGAGKSTLLKLLSRVTAPSEGTIDIYGRICSLLEVGTGFNHQMTGRENIYMNGAILGMTRAEIDGALEDIIAFSEVEEFIDTPVKRYSSGMRVKLAFAVAAHLSCEIMIMDEVLAVGDAAFQRKCLDKLRQSDRTTLYVSHNMNTVRELCTRCIVMEEGRIIFDGDTDEAIRLYLSQSASENTVAMDLTDKPHFGSGSLRMTSLTLAGKETPAYDSGETMVLRLEVSSEAETEARLRLTLRSDFDQSIGTAWSGPVTIPAGDSSLRFTFPLTAVRKGVFFASLGLYGQNELGRRVQLDHITRAFKFEVRGKNWPTGAFGYIDLGEIDGELLSGGGHGI